MRKIYFLQFALAMLLLLNGYMLKAQGGVAVNAAGTPPDSSALFDLSSVSKGFLMPRMNTAQRNAISSPATGLFIFNTDCNVVNFNAGTPASPNWATLNSSNALVAGVTIAANPVGAVCAGSNVTFAATPTQGNLSPSYQWQVNGANVGTNSTTYSTSALNNGDVVTCILSSTADCITGSPATSNPITMLVNSIPTITQTYPDSFCSGNPASLSATASSGNINWYSASTGGSSLATSGTYVINGLYSTTTYYVDATSNGCTTSSRTAVTATYFPNTPGQPGTISGPTTETLNATATYSVSPVPNAGSYYWTVSLGTITSGQGTNSINVTWDTFGFGYVTVVAQNACGTSPVKTLEPVSIASNTQTFNYTGGQQTYTVPNGVTQIALGVYGAQGGGQYSNGGLGGLATGNLAVTGGETIYLFIGGQNGYNGGGSGGGMGGGMSDVRVGGTSTANWVLVAGGGGGGGNNGNTYINTPGGSGGGGVVCANGAGGGGGGYATGGQAGQGGDGTCTTGGASGYSTGGWAGGAGGGGLTGGGTGGASGGYGNAGGDGSQGQGGSAASGCGCGTGSTGGGGGGYYGGGGASAGCCAGGSGGGGSSWSSPSITSPSFWGGLQSGNGQIVILW